MSDGTDAEGCLPINATEPTTIPGTVPGDTQQQTVRFAWGADGAEFKTMVGGLASLNWIIHTSIVRGFSLLASFLLSSRSMSGRQIPALSGRDQMGLGETYK